MPQLNLYVLQRIEASNVGTSSGKIDFISWRIKYLTTL